MSCIWTMHDLTGHICVLVHTYRIYYLIFIFLWVGYGAAVCTYTSVTLVLRTCTLIEIIYIIAFSPESYRRAKLLPFDYYTLSRGPPLSRHTRDFPVYHISSYPVKDAMIVGHKHRSLCGSGIYFNSSNNVFFFYLFYGTSPWHCCRSFCWDDQRHSYSLDPSIILERL